MEKRIMLKASEWAALNERISDLEDRVTGLMEYTIDLRREFFDEFDEKVDAHVCHQMYVQTVDNLKAYEKGKIIKPIIEKLGEEIAE